MSAGSPIGCVYLITNTANQKRYVGQTQKPLRRRFAEHCEPGRSMYVARAIRKYGRELFRVEPIEFCRSVTELNKSEKFWIAWYETQYPNGYNALAATGGEAPGPLTRRKMSAAAREGASRYWLGKKRSPEDRARMSAGQRRRFEDPEQRKHQASLQSGRVATDETRRRISEAHKIRLSDPIVRAQHNARLDIARAKRVFK